MQIVGDEIVAQCPDCEHELMLGTDPELGESITCPNCWAYLIVTNLNPIELSWDVAEDEEDDLGGSEAD